MRGDINYYGAFYRSELHSLARRIDEHLVRWAMHKFKRLRGKPSRAWDWVVAAVAALPVSVSPNSSPTGTLSRPPKAGLWE